MAASSGCEGIHLVLKPIGWKNANPTARTPPGFIQPSPQAWRLGSLPNNALRALAWRPPCPRRGTPRPGGRLAGDHPGGITTFHGNPVGITTFHGRWACIPLILT